MSIEDRLQALENRVDRYRVGMVAAGVLCVALTMASAARQDSAPSRTVSDVVRTRGVEVVDSDGREVVSIKPSDSGGRIDVKSTRGRKAASLQSMNDGSGLVEVFAPADSRPEAQPIVLIGSCSLHKSGSVTTCDTDGRVLVEVCRTDNESRGRVVANQLSIVNTDWKTVVELGTTDHGGCVLVRNGSGKEACSLSVNAIGNGEVAAWNQEGKSRTLAPTQPPPAAVQAPATESATESRIDGSFDGFENGRLYKLQNGQIWEQTSFDMSIAVRLSPEVLIYKSGGVWKIKVEGQDRTPSVRRVR